MTDQPAAQQVRTVAVDFDGVVHAYSKGWHDGTIYDEPNPGALDALRLLMRHYAVFIHTTRDPHDVAAWLRVHGFECLTWLSRWAQFWNTQGVLLITSRKLPAIAYIDDRAIRFTNWTQALGELGVTLPIVCAPAVEPQPQSSTQQRGVSSSSSSTS